MAKIIVGLGNPGIEYHRSKHNIGRDVLEMLSFFKELRWQDKYRGTYASYDLGGERFHFINPMTYMNLSGQSVQPLAGFFKVPPEDILVLHDELDLPFGTIAFKSGGGLAGHNGLKSVAEHLGTKDFKRLRLGIGRPVNGSVSSWVLSGFPPKENEYVEDYFKGVAKAIELYMESGFDKAASRYSKKAIVSLD